VFQLYRIPFAFQVKEGPPRVTTIDTTGSDVIGPRPRLSRLEGQYYLALLSMAVIDLFLSAVFLHLSGKLWLIGLRLPEVIVLLGIVPLIGGRMLFAPIRHFMATVRKRPATGRPIWAG
jgi:hypothetical protein